MIHSGVACTLVLFSTLTAAQTEPTIEQISARLTPNNLRADVSFLASDLLQGRATPSPGLDIAAEYIAAEFRRAGLEPAGDDGFFQTARYDNITSDASTIEFALQTSKGTIKAQKQSMALQEASAVDFDRLAFLKVTVTDGASLAAVLPEQVYAKVLVLDFPKGSDAGRVMSAMRQLPLIMTQLRPALVVVASGPPGDAVSALREIPRTSSTPVLLVWDNAILAAFNAQKPGLGGATISARIPAPSVVQVKLHNVVGVLRGSDPVLRDTFVLVTAHYDHLGVRGTGDSDHIYHGANDDASGTASVIEIASALAAQGVRPKRSIVFITFFGEELGLLGSLYYTAHPVFPIGSTIADVNLEQLGRTDVDGALSVGVVNVTGYDFSTLTDVVRKTGEATGVHVVKNKLLSSRYFAAGDNQALADQGVPSHTLSVGYVFPDHHQPGDEWTKLDYDNLAKVDHTVALAVFRIANSIQTPQWNEDISDTQSYIKARRGSLGKP